jgi:hypothetical protein
VIISFFAAKLIQRARLIYKRQPLKKQISPRQQVHRRVLSMLERFARRLGDGKPCDAHGQRGFEGPLPCVEKPLSVWTILMSDQNERIGLASWSVCQEQLEAGVPPASFTVKLFEG